MGQTSTTNDNVEDVQPHESNFELLCIVIDVNPINWLKIDSLNATTSESDSSFQKFLNQLLIFINAYLSNDHRNLLTVIASHPKACEYVYPNQLSVDTVDNLNNFYYQFRDVNLKFKEGLDKFLHKVKDRQSNSEYSSLTAGLSKAVCYIHQASSTYGKCLKPRILTISVSGDAPNQYIPMMNTIFSIQPTNVPIDCIKLFGPDSTFLKQGAYLSKGHYLDLRNDEKKVDWLDGNKLLQYMLFVMLPGSGLKTKATGPPLLAVDFRAACFCHKKVIDIGYVCSVCLSIFCKKVSKCTTCSSNFEINDLNSAVEPIKRKLEA